MGNGGPWFWRGARRGASAASRAIVEPLSVVLPRLVVPEATGAELQAALLMNAGDHDLLDELQPLADHARGVRTPTMASKSTPGAGRRTSPASARGRRVARQRRSPAPVAGTASTPGRRRHRGDQGDAGSCDPNWGQPVSPPSNPVSGGSASWSVRGPRPRLAAAPGHGKRPVGRTARYRRATPVRLPAMTKSPARRRSHRSGLAHTGCRDKCGPSNHHSESTLPISER